MGYGIRDTGYAGRTWANFRDFREDLGEFPRFSTLPTSRVWDTGYGIRWQDLGEFSRFLRGLGRVFEISDAARTWANFRDFCEDYGEFSRFPTLPTHRAWDTGYGITSEISEISDACSNF